MSINRRLLWVVDPQSWTTVLVGCGEHSALMLSAVGTISAAVYPPRVTVGRCGMGDRDGMLVVVIASFLGWGRRLGEEQ